MSIKESPNISVSELRDELLDRNICESYLNLPIPANAYTQVIQSRQIADESPPNPQGWGSRTVQSPPTLGD
jgi:hypothetical protein